MDRTNSFTWEDLATEDAVSGQCSAAGRIPRIYVFNIRAGVLTFICTTVLTTIRIETDHEREFIA